MNVKKRRSDEATERRREQRTVLGFFPSSLVYCVFVAPSLCLLLLFSCKREERDFKVPPPDASTVFKLSVTDFDAGGPATQPAGVAGYVNNSYEENAYAISNGQQLFNQFNCSGCHAHGGGGMGPPLMDAQWIYGSRPEQIFATIVEGRPNGMPSWRNRIPAYEIWQIVAYVRSMSGLTNQNARSGRDDHMQGATPPSSMETEHPRQSFTPPSVEMPQ